LAVVVVGWLWALVSVLLWRADIRQRQSSFARHPLLTEHRSFAVEEGILAEVDRHSYSEAAAARRSRRYHRGIAGRDSRTCRVTMCDRCRGFFKCPRVLAEKPNSRE
jgi:hypothetical protein